MLVRRTKFGAVIGIVEHDLDSRGVIRDGKPDE